MRTISTDQSTVLASDGRARGESVRVQVKDSGGTWRDLTTYPGFNALDSCTWQEDVDSPHMTAEILLHREHGEFSLAPLMENSAINRAFDPANSYSPLLALGREIRIDVALTASGMAPASGDWFTAFHGRIDQIDPANGYQVKIDARDLAGRIADTFIETERVYAYASVSGTPVSLRLWSPGQAWTVGEYVIPSDGKRNGHFYQVTTAGTGGTSEPAWPTSSTVNDGTAVLTHIGTTSTSGFAVEAIIQRILGDNGLSSITLYTPTSPGWDITQFKQERTSVLEAIRALALQIGWDLRYKWRSSTSQFELTLYGPDRSVSSSARTFAASEYADVTQLKTDIAGIRNAICVVYSDASDKDPAGNPKRKTKLVTDSASISAYGRLYMEISEASTSQIDSSSEATTMANACLSDLKDPVADQSIDFVHGFPFIELGDYYTWTANGKHYSADQSLAVVSYQHEARDGYIRTSVSCRGKPTAGYSRWLNVGVNPNNPAAPNTQGLTPFETAAAITLSAQSIVGGLKLSTAETPNLKSLGPEYEFHIGSTSNFTPSSSTLKSVSRSRQIEIADLTPGLTYYAKVVPRVMSPNGLITRSEPTDAVSAIAGRALTAHLRPEPEYGRLPLNGGFETQFDSGSPPDHWTLSGGTWGTDVLLKSDSSGISGASYIRFASTAVSSTVFKSASFIVDASRYYAFSAWHKNISGSNGTTDFDVVWLDSGGSVISTTGATGVPYGNSVGTWRLYREYVQAPSTARFAYVTVHKETSTNHVFDVDSVRLDLLVPGGILMWGNSTLATATTGHFLSPFYVAAASSATEIQIPVPTDAVISNMYVKARTAGSNVAYQFETHINGFFDGCSASLSSGSSSASDTIGIAKVNKGDLLSLKVNSTNGGAATAAQDVIVTLQWAPLPVF